ncbi:MAG: pyridoxal kinase PdxY [Deinococcales bacterium]
MQKPQNILSIQSWVSYGHAGNAAAVFPLQRLGFEVWAVHTVQFSNHTGYGAWKGQVFSADLIQDVVQGIAERGVLPECAALLSGYMGAPETVSAMLEVAKKVRAANPDALFACDPVMGDVGRGVFVRPELPDLIRDLVVLEADILTPNQFELELLTGQRIQTLEDALKAAQALRARMRPGALVLVTSLERKANAIEVLAMSEGAAWLLETPKIPLEPPRNGTGDCVAALFLGQYLKNKSVQTALELAVSALYNVLVLTHELGTREIQLIAAQEEFIRPSKHFTASTLRI